MSRLRLVPGLALLAAGCALGPNYKRPEVPAPTAWRDLPTAEAETLANAPWWQVFDDPQLQELIKVALVENKDLKIAVERIEEARARYGFTKADLWPHIDLNATGGRLRFNPGSLVHTPEGDQTAHQLVADSTAELLTLATHMATKLFPGRPLDELPCGLSGPILTHPVVLQTLAPRSPLSLQPIAGTPIEGVRRLLLREAP